MMVMYTGTPGSGKSLDVARNVYAKLKMGRTVIGNMRIKPDTIKDCPGRYFFVDSYKMNPGDLMEYAQRYHIKGKEGQTTIVIDECQQIFNAREWNAPHMKAWNRFFQIHRHFGFDVYLITQFDRLIDRQTRGLIDYERVHRKVSKLGFWGSVASALFRGGLFICVERYYAMKLRTGSYYFVYRKKYGEFYDSYYGFFDDEKAIDENELRTFLDMDIEESVPDDGLNMDCEVDEEEMV